MNWEATFAISRLSLLPREGVGQYLCRGECRGSADEARPLGERVGRPLEREARGVGRAVGMPVSPGEVSPVPLEPELRGEAPCVGEVGESSPLMPMPRAGAWGYTGEGAPRPATAACCWRS